MSTAREQYAEQHVNRIMANYDGPIPEEEARADSRQAALEFFDTYRKDA